MELIVYIILGIMGTAPFSWGVAAGFKVVTGSIKWSTVAWAPIWMYPMYLIVAAAALHA